MRRQLSITEMEELLWYDPNMKKIHSSREWTIPMINYELWHQSVRKRNKGMIDVLVKEFFLGYKYIEDVFGDAHDDKRVPWINTYGREYGDYFSRFIKHNAPAYGHLQGFIGIRNVEGSYEGTNPETLKQLLAEVGEVCRLPFRDYRFMDFASRVDYIEKVREKVYGVLLFLSNQSPACSRD